MPRAEVHQSFATSRVKSLEVVNDFPVVTTITKGFFIMNISSLRLVALQSGHGRSIKITVL